MKTSQAFLNRILATIFSLVAIVAFAMPFVNVDLFNINNLVNTSGFFILEQCIGDVAHITHWPLFLVCFFLSAILAVLTFLFSLLSLKSRRIGTVIFSLLGIATIIFFANEVGFDYVGTGIYVYIVALFLTFIFSIVGSTKDSQE